MKIIKMSLAVAIILSFSGCGGGSDNTSTTVQDSNKGYYLDSAISGVSYSCGDKKGTTNNEGIFYFENGANCIFSYADIILRETDSKDLKSNIILYEDDVYVGRFLQSMDQDGISGNNLQMSKEVKEILIESGRTAVPKTDAEIDNLIAQLKNKTPLFRGKRVSLIDAKSHMDSTKLLYQDKTDNDELELSLDGYLTYLMLIINPGTTLGWKTNNGTDRLQNTLNILENKITIAESELDDVDISAKYQDKINALLTNTSKLSTLINLLKQKSTQLDTKIRVGSSVENINKIIEEVKVLTKGDIYKYFRDLSFYGKFPLPQVSTSPDNADQMEINRYLNQAGEYALSIVGSLDVISIRMKLVSKAYKKKIQSEIKKAYDAISDTNSDSCSIANYSNSIVLEPQLIGQCQNAYFFDCSIKKYGSSYPEKVPQMKNRIKTVCSILDGYKAFTVDGSNPKDSCDYCE